MQIIIGNVKMENVSAEEALTLMRGMTEKSGQTKIKKAYVKKGKKFEWIKWTGAEIGLMEEKILKNCTALEVVEQNLFPAHTDASVFTKFYDIRKKMMRRRKNSPKFISYNEKAEIVNEPVKVIS
jgi:hypothetical protein